MSDFILPSADGPARRPDDHEISGAVPASGAPSPDAPSRDGDEPTGLRDRISHTTRQGGFGRTLPASYDETGEDWKSILLDDPFARLFLDPNRLDDYPEEAVDRMVKQHSVIIQRFWEKKVRLVESGEAIRRTVIATYGDQYQLRAFERQIRDDAEALATPEGRKTVLDSRFNTIRTRVLARFEDFVIGDRTLSPVESERLLDQAEAEGWRRDAAATFLLSELGKRGFRNTAGVQASAGEAPAEILLSSSWTSHADDAATPERAVGRTLATAMLSGSLTAAQIQTLLAAAAEAGVDQETTARFIADRLGVFDGEWMPAPGEHSAEGALAEALASVRWLSPERFAEEKRRIAEGQRRAFAADLAPDLSGDTFTAAAARALVDGAPLEAEEASRIVLDELDRRGFRPIGGMPVGDRAAARLTSVDWALARTGPHPGDGPPEPTRSSGATRSFALLVVVVLAAVVATLSLRGAGDEPASPEPPDTPRVVAEVLSVRRSPTGSGKLVVRLLRGTPLEVTGHTINAAGYRWYQVRYDEELLWVDGSLNSIYIPSHLTPPFVAHAPPPSPGAGSTSTIPAHTDVSSESARSQVSRPTHNEHQVFDRVDLMPQLIGGLEGLQARVEYPDAARRAGIEGRVLLQFVVHESGAPTDIEVIQGIGGGCDEAAIAALRASRFTPGLRDGRPVKVRMSHPVAFNREQPPCADEFLRTLFVELREVDAQCRRLVDATAKAACEARRDRVNRRIADCTH